MSEVVIDNLARALEGRGAKDVNVQEETNKELGTFYISSVLNNGIRQKLIYDEKGQMIAEISNGEVIFNNENLSNKEKQSMVDLVEKRFGLTNLAEIANLSGKPRFQLNIPLDGSTLFGKLQLRDSEMAKNLPEGMTMESFADGYLTYIDPKELPVNANIKNKEAKLIPVITSKDSQTVFEVTKDVLEFQGNDPQSLIFDRERNTLKEDENGKIIKFPDNSSRITEVARFKIASDKLGSRSTGIDDAQYLTFKINDDYLRKGTSDSRGYNIELYYERVAKNQSGYDLKNGTHGNTRFAEEIPPYDRAQSNSEQTRSHKEDLEIDDNAAGEVADRNRGAQELNGQMKEKEKVRKKALSEQSKVANQVNGAVVSNVNERQPYVDLARRIAGESETLGVNDVLKIIYKVRTENPNLKGEELENAVMGQANVIKVPGDRRNPRMG